MPMRHTIKVIISRFMGPENIIDAMNAKFKEVPVFPGKKELAHINALAFVHADMLLSLEDVKLIGGGQHSMTIAGVVGANWSSKTSEYSYVMSRTHAPATMLKSTSATALVQIAKVLYDYNLEHALSKESLVDENGNPRIKPL